MTKKEWEEHCKWLDGFRGKTVTNSEYNENGNSKKKSKNS